MDIYINNSENIYSLCIPENSELTFTIFDSYGDGICCDWGDGYYLISAGEDTLVYNNNFLNYKMHHGKTFD